MTSQEILGSDLLDLIFDGRNKDYGAYALRKQYGGRMTLSLGLTLLLAFAGLGWFQLPKKDAPTPLPKPLDEVIVCILPPPVVPPLAPPPPPPAQSVMQPPAQVAFTDRIKLVQTLPDPPLPPLDDLEGRAVSNITTTGTPGPDILPPPAPAPFVEPAVSEPPAPAPPVAPDRSAAFPGGISAWTAFLARHLRAPDALAPGERRTVQVRFFVSADGQVSDFRIERSGGAAFDNEVVRVLRRMPRWNPAVQEGRTVAVSFVQPVTFVGEE